jgi:hypothetical protein
LGAGGHSPPHEDPCRSDYRLHHYYLLTGNVGGAVFFIPIGFQG